MKPRPRLGKIMGRTFSKGLLESVFRVKRNFTAGVSAVARGFDRIEIAPFYGGARASATISADFELAWAFRGRSEQERRQRGIRCRQNVPYLVRLLEEAGIPITWATVGHLFLDRCELGPSGFAHADMPRPLKNLRWEGDWYRHDPCTDKETDPHWYAPDLIQLIRSSAMKHEIGSHSFSHIDFSEDTSTPELVEHEIEACRKVMADHGLHLRSLVYPFNNMGHHYMDLIGGLGLTAVRHRDPMVRLSYPERTRSGVYKLCESMNLRQTKHYDYVDKVRIFLDQAIRREASYHIWFHPSDPTELFEREFYEILQCMTKLKKEGKLWVATMGDLAAYCEARNSVQIKAEMQNGTMRIGIRWPYDAKRYGETKLSFRIPVPREPKMASIKLIDLTLQVETRMEATTLTGERFCRVDVPSQATSLALVL
jgi:peptidoglycan/xylan/chitin deacetylase (PgdA/CDA1 family)